MTQIMRITQSVKSVSSVDYLVLDHLLDCVPWIAVSTRSGVIGWRWTHAPVASWIALAIAGASGTSAISDMPRAPYGPFGSASSKITGTISVGISSTVGNR